MVRIIDCRPELSGKVTVISQIAYKIRIAHFEIRQEPSVWAPRLLRISGIPVPITYAANDTTHRRLHLEWCHARRDWTATEWNQVVFRDESRFNLSSDDNHVRVLMSRGERLNRLQRHGTQRWCDGFGLFSKVLFRRLIEISRSVDRKTFSMLLLLLMPPDQQRPDGGPRNSSFQRAK
ncbi:hypothetical protein TNCV_3025971 [Trichonephila clavipes]|nr:hypothetical protein TNCV_3025971 [Trichonephila clavipes]